MSENEIKPLKNKSDVEIFDIGGAGCRRRRGLWFRMILRKIAPYLSEPSENYVFKSY